MGMNVFENKPECKMFQKNYHFTNPNACGSEFYDQTRSFYIFTIQRHCGNVKCQTMLFVNSIIVFWV